MKEVERGIKMKRKHRRNYTIKRMFIYIAIVVIAIICGIMVAIMVSTSAQADDEIVQIDKFIEEHSDYVPADENETVSLSYAEWQEEQIETEYIEETEVDLYSMDVWTLGSYLYGISELDTTRTLKLISCEGYGAESPLSYYVGCCCWVRCTEGLWGYDNLYSCFGGADCNYGEWMDGIEIADYAYDVLWQVYMNPSYVTSCNGMECPAEYVYSEWTEDGLIYVW